METNETKMKLSEEKKGNSPVVQDNEAEVKAFARAPILSLVPVPEFAMNELVVDFNMEVKSTEMQDDKTQEEASSTLSYNSWFGLNASITGNVSSESEHKRQTDSSATYNIHAKAAKQPPSEGMEKLASLLAQTMESIPEKTK